MICVFVIPMSTTQVPGAEKKLSSSSFSSAISLASPPPKTTAELNFLCWKQKKHEPSQVSAAMRLRSTFSLGTNWTWEFKTRIHPTSQWQSELPLWKAWLSTRLQPTHHYSFLITHNSLKAGLPAQFCHCIMNS